MTLLRRNSISLYSGLLVLFCFVFTPGRGQLQTVPQKVESTVGVTDSISIADSTQNKDTLTTRKKQVINTVVDYQANDSLVFFAGGTGLLYGEAKVVYGEMNLNAGLIQMKMDSSLLYATGKLDSVGKKVQNPVFKDKAGEYESKELRYNFKSGKGMITQAITQQGEGYIVSGQTKKLADDIMCMVDGKYTTCDNHDHPHFYLDLSRAKVKPGSYIVSGPAHLVMEDVDLPLYLPFGYFPFKGDYSSGMLTPTYGDELTRGFYLKDGGYYFAFNDYVDLALTGEIYSKGSWGLSTKSSYKVKYRFSGAFNASYLETVSSEKNLPDYSKSKNFSMTWSHSQDPKANPFRTFSASVNFQTSGYSRNDLKSYYNPEAFSNNTKSSSINYTQRFPESPFSLSSSVNITQRSADSTLSVTLPTFSLSMSSISPFKRKNPIGSERWYEKIRVSYSGNFANSISQVKEKEIMQKSLIKDWRNGIKHSIPVSATFNALNYINITPSFSYTERWYSSSQNKYFDETLNKVMVDTLWGFNRVWDYSMGVSASTKMYGYYTPIRKLFGDKVNMIRHVLTPSVSYTYRPDFGQEKYGYYDNYTFTDSKGVEQTVNYSHYETSLYGVPGKGKSGSVNFSLANNLEMKLKQETDTATIYKKVSLIDNFSFGSSYNLAADSLNWSDISANIRIKFGSKYTLNLSGAFDPYCYALNSSGNPVKINTTQFQKYGIPGRLTGTGTSFSYAFSNATFKKKEKKKELASADASKADFKADGQSEDLTEAKPYDPEASLYTPFTLPWTLNVSYNLRYARSDFDKQRLEFNYDFIQNLSFNGSVTLTPKWSMNASTSYDFKTKKLATMNCSVTRDLHCWQMSASFIPIGPYKSYNFSIRVKSTLLQDLKYEQHQNPKDNSIWGN